GKERGELKGWCPADGETLFALEDQEAITAVGFSRDGARLATALGGTTVVVRDAATFTPVLQLQMSGTAPCTGMAFSADAPWRIAAVSSQGTVKAWAPNGTELYNRQDTLEEDGRA